MRDKRAQSKAHLILPIALIFLWVTTNLHNWRELKGIFLSDFIEYQVTEGEVFETKIGILDYGYRTEAAEVNYAYWVNGEFYVSDLVNFANDEYEVDYYLEKYPKGKKVNVYYEKDNPAFAVLEPSNWSFRTIRSTFFIFMALLVYLLLWLSCPRYQWCIKLAEKYDDITDPIVRLLDGRSR